jgi:hypothetical protein
MMLQCITWMSKGKREGKAAGGIRTPGLLITNQPLYH